MLKTYHCVNRHFLSEGIWFVLFLFWPVEVLERQHHSLYPFITGKFDIHRLLGTRGGKVQFCVSTSILETGNNFCGVCRACCTLHTRCWAPTGKLFLLHSCLADISKTGTPKRHIVLTLILRKGALGVGDKVW